MPEQNFSLAIYVISIESAPPIRPACNPRTLVSPATGRHKQSVSISIQVNASAPTLYLASMFAVLSHVMLISDGARRHGSPSICIGSARTVAIRTDRHWHSRTHPPIPTCCRACVAMETILSKSKPKETLIYKHHATATHQLGNVCDADHLNPPIAE